MKVMSTYSIRPGCVKEAVSQFLAGEANPPAGVKIIGRWHKTDSSGGYTLMESDSPVAMFEFAASWSEVLETHSTIVIEDAEAGAVLAKVFK
ncbi:MAG: DUF3303 family protein [Terracidiphilus sp.]